MMSDVLKKCKACSKEVDHRYVPPRYTDGRFIGDGDLADAMCLECYRKEDQRRQRESWSVERSARQVTVTRKALLEADVAYHSALADLAWAVERSREGENT